MFLKVFWFISFVFHVFIFLLFLFTCVSFHFLFFARKGRSRHPPTNQSFRVYKVNLATLKVAMNCIRTLKRQRRCKREKSRTSRRKETSTSRKMDVRLQSQLTWSCKPEQTCRKNKVNGPEDAVVNETDKQLLQEKIYIITQ